MSSLVAALISFIDMQEFEIKTINSTIHLPRLWLRYVDDIFVIQRGEHSNQFMQQINIIDPHIQFIQETVDPRVSISFLDTLVAPTPSSTLLTTVYRKPTYTDEYLNWDSHSNFSAAENVFYTSHIALGQVALPPADL